MPDKSYGYIMMTFLEEGFMLLLKLDKKIHKPLYQQILEQIREKIEKRVLLPGEILPSVS
jgi:hypothetical protein